MVKNLNLEILKLASKRKKRKRRGKDFSIVLNMAEIIKQDILISN